MVGSDVQSRIRCDSGIAELVLAVERFRATPRPRRTCVELEDDLLALRRACDLLDLSFAERAADFAAVIDDSQESPVEVLRKQMHLSTQRASDAIVVGQQAAALPQSVAAVSEGRIGFDHLAPLARTAQALRSSETAAPFNELFLLSRAMKHTVTRFRRDCAHVRHANDMQAFLTQHREEVEWRQLEILNCGDGCVSIRGFLDGVGGAAVRAVLEPLARRSGADDERPAPRRLADALVEVCTHALDTADLPVHGGRRPHLQVTTTLETLLGLPGAPAGEMEFAGPVPSATVQRIACDASVCRILLGPDSVITDVGRSRRVASTPMKRALAARDGGCVWPGCERPPSWTEAHHVLFWGQHRGTTHMPNLALLCHRHHWMVHEGGWQIVRADDGFTTVPPIFASVDQPRGPDPGMAA